MSIQAINEYHNKVHQILRFGETNNEQSIKDEFAFLINNYYCNKYNLFLIKEKTIKNKSGKNIRPDGILRDTKLNNLGYWESKSNVNLEHEIINKINAGYPLDNTLFQDDKEVVLFQNDKRYLETSLHDKEKLDKLLIQFVTFKSKEVKAFYDAIEKFKLNVVNILDIIKQEILIAETLNPQFKEKRKHFLNICEKSINPNISINDINEMLLQHILTEEIFTSIFDNADFHRDNNIAKELYNLEETFFKGKTKRDTLAKIQEYYATIKKRAASIVDHHDKQAFLKIIYEDFYTIYNPKAADRMGIVYTPNEIVKFQIQSVDYLLEKHFNKTLAHNGIKILDPCVGTGTYICELIDYLPPNDLKHKFNHDIFCNELGLLPYYIANLNIEYTYQQKMGEYNEFNNLCWVDTLDNTAFNFKGSNTELFGLSVENTARIKSQNEQQISVIIGNPPYNANQQNENDNNKNREYPKIDDRIKQTYIKESNAQKTKVYDMYSRFYRWATDRINNEQGIISFITNNSFINAKTFDGFRKCISQEFDFTYIIDTKSDVRANPKIAGTTHNVFGIQTGVSIIFLVKKKAANKQPCKIYYISLQDEMLKSEKLQWLSDNKIQNIEFDLIIPDKDNNWINQTDNDFDSLIPVCDKEVKAKKDGQAIFKLFSNGVLTARDEWVYDFNKNNLEEKIKFFIDSYNKSLNKKNYNWNEQLKWSEYLKGIFNRNLSLTFKNELIIKSNYRPFIKQFYYAEPLLSDRLTQNHYDMFGEIFNKKNTLITTMGDSTGKPFFVLSINALADLNFVSPASGGTRCYPLYIYDKGGNQQDNITNWALEQFQSHYNNQEITKEQIFNYVYAVLHDPHYRKKYEQNLKREFPRIPFYDNFEQWANSGKELIDLHLNYETVEKYPLTRIDTDKVKIPKAKLKADKPAGTIQLDDNTRLENVPCEAWEYLLGNRSALEWVLDQYKEKTPKDTTIAANFNAYQFADYKEHVIDLLMRVCTVSIETVKITKAMN